MLDLENRKPFTFHTGSLPVLVSFPHNGSFIPGALQELMTADGQSSKDTDWFLDRLYDFPELENGNKLIAEFSRYVIDLNRPADNVSLYPGQTTTGLVPETCFDGSQIYLDAPPTSQEIEARVENIWTPYHDQIRTRLDEIRQQHGYAVLIEAHSIRSQVPRLFPGTLPDFNVGTNNGASCDAELQDRIVNVLKAQNNYSHVVNGRFIGGYITRHFGNPKNNISAVQFELSQATYLDEEKAQWDDANAAKVQAVFREIIQAIVKWNPNPAT